MQGAGMVTFNANADVAADAAPEVPLIGVVQHLLACQDLVKFLQQHISTLHVTAKSVMSLKCTNVQCRMSGRFTSMGENYRSCFRQCRPVMKCIQVCQHRMVNVLHCHSHLADLCFVQNMLHDCLAELRQDCTILGGKVSV